MGVTAVIVPLEAPGVIRDKEIIDLRMSSSCPSTWLYIVPEFPFVALFNIA